MRQDKPKVTRAMARLQKAESDLAATVREFQAERRRQDELGKKRERFVKAVEEAKEQRAKHAYEAHAQDNPEAMKILTAAQEKTRKVENELTDLDAAIAGCAQRVTDLEAKQQECQRAVDAATAAAEAEKIESIAAEIDPLVNQIIDKLQELHNSIEAARGYAHNSLPENDAGPVPFWQIQTKIFLRYVTAMLMQRGVTLLEITSPECPDHSERKEFAESGSFKNYVAGLVNRGLRRLKLPPDDADGAPT